MEPLGVFTAAPALRRSSATCRRKGGEGEERGEGREGRRWKRMKERGEGEGWREGERGEERGEGGKRGRDKGCEGGKKNTGMREKRKDIGIQSDHNTRCRDMKISQS